MKDIDRIIVGAISGAAISTLVMIAISLGHIAASLAVIASPAIVQ